MQTIDAVIPEISNQIVYPSAEQIARKVLEHIGVSSLFENNLFFVHDGETSSDFTSDNGKIRSHENRCDIEIVPSNNPRGDEFNSFRVKDTEAAFQSHHQYHHDQMVFGDKKDKISLYENGVPCVVNMTFTLKLKSLELVDLINTTLYSRSLTDGAYYDYNQVTFNYGIPDRVLLSLYKMFKLKDFGTHTVSFGDYLKYGSNGAIGLVSNRNVAGMTQEEITTHSVVSITRSVTDLLGKLTYGGDRPDADKQGKMVDRYSLSFEYVFIIFKPTQLKLAYPPMINNVLLPEVMLHSDKQRREGNLMVGKEMRDRSLNDHFANNKNVPNLNSYKLVRFPANDNWIFSSAIYSKFKTDYIKRVIALLQVDVDEATGDKKVEIDITNDIFPMLDIDTIEAIDDCFKLADDSEILSRQSVFGIAIFADDYIVDRNRITFERDPYRITIADDTLDISRRYRFMITQFVNIKLIPYKFVYFMLDNFEYFTDYLVLNIKYLVKFGFLTIVKGPLSDPEISVPRNYKTPLPFRNEYLGRALTIGNYIVAPTPPRR